jgi:hypothetical protein
MAARATAKKECPSEERKDGTAAGASSRMDEDDVIIEVLHQLAAVGGPRGLSALSATNKQIYALAGVLLRKAEACEHAREGAESGERCIGLDVIWRPICIARWAPYPQGRAWADAAQCAEAGSEPSVWKAQYRARERELVSGACPSFVHALSGGGREQWLGSGRAHWHLLVPSQGHCKSAC